MKKMKIIIIILLSYLSLLAQPFDFKEIINISRLEKESSFRPDIFRDKYDSIHVAWVYSDRIDNTRNLYYCYGKNTFWSKPIKLTDNVKIYSPHILVNDYGLVFISYDEAVGEYSRTKIITKEDGIWQKPMQISDDSLGWGFNSEITIDSNNVVYVFYSNFSGIYWRIYDGTSWSEVDSVITVPPALTALTKPKVVIDKNNNIHLIFRYYDEFLNTSILYYMIYDGKDWSEMQPLSAIDSLGGPRDYSIAIDQDNNPHVVYTQKNRILDAGIILFYTNILDNNWTIPDSITTENDGKVFAPKIRINSQNNKPLIIATIDTSMTHINESNAFFIYQCHDGWCVKKTLNNFPDITISSFDFLFDWQGYIDYVFTWLHTSYFSEIYYSKGELITSVEAKENFYLDDFRIEAYPNPFNSSIKIKYRIPKAELITITIYDSIGQKIKKIVSDYKEIGDHEIVFNAKNLASGVYLIELKSSKHHKTIKTLLTK